ncbi:hypothetical protein BDV93DRAFT_544946 [Ceratobasidium sp. AG-I]|nr:hypothetical protein BDV93DRAFT_544946 [Ceratobasidium sp. AG-I]
MDPVSSPPPGPLTDSDLPPSSPRTIYVMSRSHMSTTVAASCFVALIALALTVVWRRRQRWRRTRPWLAKLRAEAASKIEKEKSTLGDGAHRDDPLRSTTKDITKDTPKDTLNETDRSKRKEKERLAADARSDGGSASGKRSKERRRRGKDIKQPSRMVSGTALSQMANNALDASTPTSNSTLKLSVHEPKPDQAQVQAQSQTISPPPSPYFIPLPPSPQLNASDITPSGKFIPPALVLSGPASPLSTSMSIPTTEITATTPTTSTSVSPTPASPMPHGHDNAARKLPAFPPASPLPPSLARKPLPLARRATPSVPATSPAMPNSKDANTPERKDSHAAGRKSTGYESDGGVPEIEFPTLSPWPVVGKRVGEGEGKRRDKDGRRVSDAGRDGRKISDAGRGRKASDARKKVGGGNNGGGAPGGAGTNPESTQLASLRGALEAARLREEEVAEERKRWAKRERELQTQVDQLAHQLHALAISFSTGGMHGYPPYGYAYGVPSAMGQPGPAMTPGAQPQAPPPTHSTSEPSLPSSQPSPAPTPPPGSPPSTSQAPNLPQPNQSQPPYPMYLPFPFPMHMPSPHSSPMPSSSTPMSFPPHVPLPPPSSMMSPPPQPMMSPPQPHGSMSPPQPSPYMVAPHPWGIHMGMGMAHRGGSPMSPGGMMGTPGPGGMMGGPAPGMMMQHPVPGRRHSGFFSGSPRRGGSRSNSRSPYVQAWADGRRGGTPSTPSVGSVDDGLVSGLRGGWEGGYTAGVKREREYDEPEGGAGSESDESDEDEDSDEDSVIFEDGSVSDSLNLSLRGDSKDSEIPVEIQIGEDLRVSEIMS